MDRMRQRFVGGWNLRDLGQIESNGLKVFSCFHCGGGSTMGYKLAGFDVLGGVEIDVKIAEMYQHNHKPRFPFVMGVKEFNALPDSDIPKELYDLDILDGSPPCSSFSTSGKRDEKWGVLSYFREGQAEQILDDLFFDFIATAKRLQPKVVIAENVMGLVAGKAKWYVGRIFAELAEAGYAVQLFQCDASRMGVPQTRKRIFFIARRLDLGLSALTLAFNETPISIRAALAGVDSSDASNFIGRMLHEYWLKLKPGERPIGKWFSLTRCHPDLPCPTIPATAANPALASPTHWDEPRKFSRAEYCRLQSFPDDYDFGELHAAYVCGMSVPPFMMQRIALEVGRQWFDIEYTDAISELPSSAQ
jgi:DNA (cytosine-5)-methyltransferase 1